MDGNDLSKAFHHFITLQTKKKSHNYERAHVLKRKMKNKTKQSKRFKLKILTH